ncbi:hypothetical protein HK096_002489 [Nowakowskiella sp. JEL0078]|nr:hypothetical protein HK096_002489 [Nowakowskiella sp. JEL0078]
MMDAAKSHIEKDDVFTRLSLSHTYASSKKRVSKVEVASTCLPVFTKKRSLSLNPEIKDKISGQQNSRLNRDSVTSKSPPPPYSPIRCLSPTSVQKNIFDSTISKNSNLIFCKSNTKLNPKKSPEINEKDISYFESKSKGTVIQPSQSSKELDLILKKHLLQYGPDFQEISENLEARFNSLKLCTMITQEIGEAALASTPEYFLLPSETEISFNSNHEEPKLHLLESHLLKTLTYGDRMIQANTELISSFLEIIKSDRVEDLLESKVSLPSQNCPLEQGANVSIVNENSYNRNVHEVHQIQSELQTTKDDISEIKRDLENLKLYIKVVSEKQENLLGLAKNKRPNCENLAVKKSKSKLRKNRFGFWESKGMILP